GVYAVGGVVFDYGNTTAQALSTGRGRDGERDNGNGSLMRAVPLAFFDVTDDEVRAASAVTHAHPTSTEACVAYVRAARALLDGGDARAAARAAGYDGVWDRRREDIRSSGYVLDTLPAALWCLATTDSYAACVLAAVNLGDDSDTTAAVAGALAGILYGFDDERDDGRGIPGQWDDALRGWGVIANVVSGGPLDVEDWNSARSMAQQADGEDVRCALSACEQGDELVMNAMLAKSERDRDGLFERAGRSFAVGVELGDAQCATNLGVLYLYRHLQADDTDVAAYACFERGADMGSAECACYLGDMHRDGRGVEADMDEAFSCYERAYQLVPTSLERSDPRDCVIIAMINLRMGQAFEWRLADEALGPAEAEDIRAHALTHYGQARDCAQRAVDAGLRMNVKEVILAQAGIDRLAIEPADVRRAGEA
ncbi:MAG: ADP-ribosylglycohydrolase family protein, partial [Bifidobacterium sp.]|nr:ADP-ribosylglycohydrolase family protein [Bifidobacterium sp.]